MSLNQKIRSDAGLLSFSGHAVAELEETFNLYGLAPAQYAQLDSLHTAYANSLRVAQDPSTATRGNVAQKNADAKKLRTLIGQINSVVQGQASVTDKMKLDLGLTVRDRRPTPVPAPVEAPQVTVLGVDGHAVVLSVSRPVGLDGRVPRGRLPGVVGASVVWFAGEVAPSDLSLWHFHGNTSRPTTVIDLPDSLAPGTPVYVTAFWYNRRSESGPAARAATATVGFGGLSKAG